MKYEVGGHWNLETPGVREGLIGTKEQRRNVGYVNDPDDRGGETKYGIAKNANMDLDITNLDWEGAKRVYYKRYWLQGDCEDLPPRLALMHFDGCVNHGIGRAARFLQRAVGATEDGDIGPETLSKLAQLDEMEVVDKVAKLREQFYEDIVESNPSQAKFLNGWRRRITEVWEFIHNIST